MSRTTLTGLSSTCLYHIVALGLKLHKVRLMADSRDAAPNWWSQWGRRVAIPLGLVAVIGVAFWMGLASFSGVQTTSENEWATKVLDVPPVEAGKPIPAKTASLPYDAAVLAVSVGGKHRAYPVASMSTSINHVVNDRINNRPIAVVYCDRTQCVRAFAASEGQPQLGLAVGGWLNDGETKDMLVRNGTHRYQLKTGQATDPNAPPFPFESVNADLTTWGKWRDAHPDGELVQDWKPLYAIPR